MFRVCAKKMLQKNLVKEHAGFVDQHNMHFMIFSAKFKFNLLHSNPFSDDEIFKITFVLNNLFKVTSLDIEGWEENFIYETNVIAEVSQFILTFEFFNNIDFNFLQSEIVESNVFSL